MGKFFMVSMPSTVPVEIDSRDTIAKFILGEQRANGLFHVYKTCFVLLMFMSMIAVVCFPIALFQSNGQWYGFGTILLLPAFIFYSLFLNRVIVSELVKSSTFWALNCLNCIWFISLCVCVQGDPARVVSLAAGWLTSCCAVTVDARVFSKTKSTIGRRMTATLWLTGAIAATLQVRYFSVCHYKWMILTLTRY
jgi:hypothetical protein